MENLLQDLRLSVRKLARTPLLTGAALLCLALGTGANSAIFSVVNTILLRPLPFEDMDRVLMVANTHAEEGGEPQRLAVDPQSYLEWKRRNRVFEPLSAVEPRSFNLTGNGEPERLEGAAISAEWLPAMGLRPAFGRGITPQEDRPGAEKVVLLGHGLWSRRFGADSGIVGRTILLNDESHVVIGIMPQGLQFPYGSELWVPLAIDPEDAGRYTWHTLGVFGRLKPGVTFEQAKGDMERIARDLEREFPQTNSGWGVDLRTLRFDLTGDMQAKLLALLAAAGFVLLIAVANVSNLLLARAQEQSGEIAVRTALGAGRRQLVRLALVEGLVLSLAGGALGLLLAFWAVRPLVALSPVATMAVFFRDIRIDPMVLAFTLGVSLVTGLAFGLIPALRAARPNLQGLLKESGRSSLTRRGHRLFAALVVGEVALAVLLLAGAGLTVKSFRRLQDISPGYAPQGVLTMRISVPMTRYSETHQRIAFFRQLMERVRALPGVVAAGATSTMPVKDNSVHGMFTIEGRPLAFAGEVLITNHRLVTPGYLEAMKIPLLKGRTLTEADHENAPGVAVISREMATRFWPGKDPIGKRLKRGAPDSENPWLTVVGVVEDVRDYGPTADIEPAWYLPFAQHDLATMSLIVRTDRDPVSLAGAVRAEVAALDRDQPVFNVAPLEQYVADSMVKERFSALLVSLFAAVGLVLAAVGIYGVMSFSVSQRFQEIGVRMALGAEPGRIRGLVLRRGMGLALIGVAVGLAGAFALTRLITGMLHGVSPTDPLTFAAISLGALTVAFLANYLPARKATRVDPIVVLRSE